ncbi:MAG: SAM-dependent chlorinase/fluorinase [Gloeomargarita sp. SKYBB_i_bin120]|nr:SAM-dependent chlorinase/fluorinase [Gloeomargarita sp. SKYG98]MCS7291609.1 SAM-dependent chlorinase/fluorinase [Gloeomargarita sp. SKYB120]MDW8177169.1 SAM-dependent chlorinase/fluorinase [Gloeomargarita sp. SKYBB_i_bin120]
MAVVALLTDFGTQDHYVGVLKGVIFSLCPQAQVVDIGHGVPPYQELAAQFLLQQAYPYFPPGTIYLVVVDPGVGSARRPLALRTPWGYGVGPDNGIFTPWFDQAEQVVVLNRPRYWRTPTPSQTFHGRDIFAPVAAHLAVGVPLTELGESVDPATLVRESPPPPIATATGWRSTIQYIDHFGNLITTLPAAGLPRAGAFTVELAGRRIPWGRSYSDVPVGALVALVGSHGYVEIACRQGNAAQVCGAKIGDAVALVLPTHGDNGENPSHPGCQSGPGAGGVAGP